MKKTQPVHSYRAPCCHCDNCNTGKYVVACAEQGKGQG